MIFTRLYGLFLISEWSLHAYTNIINYMIRKLREIQYPVYFLINESMSYIILYKLINIIFQQNSSKYILYTQCVF